MDVKLMMMMKGIITGEGEEMEGGDGKEGSESECWKDKNHVV